MFELVQVASGTYYINSPAKIGIYTPDGRTAYLIDSGNDKDAGRKVLKILTEKGWTLAAIFNTHSNADHIGGNRYLQSQTGCAIFTPDLEAAFTRHPILESSFLYGGYPCRELRHKFLLAQESEALPLTDPTCPNVLAPIPLPGHFLDMVGYRTPDDVVFLADCLCSTATLDKYGIPFLYDAGAYLATLDAVAGMQAALFVPAHAEATADIAPLAAYNREKLHQSLTVLLALCQTPLCFEEVLQGVFAHYSLTMTLEQYVLVGSTVRSLLAWLKDEGRMTYAFEGARMLWQAVNA